MNKQFRLAEILKLVLLIALSSTVLVACIEVGAESASDSVYGKSNGVSGSTARYTIQNGFLVTIEDSYINVYALDNPANPFRIGDTYLWRGDLETIFPQGNNRLFVGSQNATYVLEIDDQGNLTELAEVSHVRSCDPVVANETHMFVTLRETAGCQARGEQTNRLIVYSLDDITQPTEIDNVAIDQPYGLGLAGNELLVCYADGLKRFDVTDPSKLIELNDYYGTACDDVIAFDRGGVPTLILSGIEGVSQVEDQVGNLIELSVIRSGS